LVPASFLLLLLTEASIFRVQQRYAVSLSLLTILSLFRQPVKLYFWLPKQPFLEDLSPPFPHFASTHLVTSAPPSF